MRCALDLTGCTPTPLASYLKALGVLRLVAEQEDATAAGFWRNDRFVLESRLDAAGLEAFLLERYRPTPIVAPWGGRSGFYPGQSEKSAREALEHVSASHDERLGPFRETIAQVRSLLDRLGMTEKARDDAKLDLLRTCRAELPDHVLPWLDACYVLTADDRAFPPLLGTGGNEGSGSYVSAFAQLVVACLIEHDHDRALASALFRVARPDTGSDVTPGQFAPLAAGGPNATTGFEGRSLLNPWDFLLCLEGTLLFAAAATKRLEAASGDALAFPFTVRTVGAGAGSVALGDESNARAETWFPLWERPARLSELAAVFAEGRVQVSGRTARDALDFARAVSSLGLQRGITSFQRYGYLQRFGRNVIAVPVERVEVQRGAHGDLIDSLEVNGWLDQIRRRARRDTAPARLRSLISRLENALFDLTRSGDPSRVQAVLTCLGNIQVHLTTSPAARKDVLPVPQLPDNWVHAADDGSAEFRIAAALAGLHAIVQHADGPRAALPMRVHFAPLSDRNRWLDVSGDNVAWSPGFFEANLVELAERRIRWAMKNDPAEGPWVARATARLDDVAALLDDDIDTVHLQNLLPGLVLTHIPGSLKRFGRARAWVPPAYSVLKPFFASRRQLMAAGVVSHTGGDTGRAPDPVHLADTASVVRLLAAHRVADAVAVGVHRLRTGGLTVLTSMSQTAHPVNGRRLLAALLVPIESGALRQSIKRIAKRADQGGEKQHGMILARTETEG